MASNFHCSFFSDVTTPTKDTYEQAVWSFFSSWCFCCIRVQRCISCMDFFFLTRWLHVEEYAQTDLSYANRRLEISIAYKVILVSGRFSMDRELPTLNHSMQSNRFIIIAWQTIYLIDRYMNHIEPAHSIAYKAKGKPSSPQPARTTPNLSIITSLMNSLFPAQRKRGFNQPSGPSTALPTILSSPPAWL